jgi:hypothetical protein
MTESKASVQVKLVDVAEVPQPVHDTPPSSTSAAPVRVRQKRTRKPSPRPVTYLLDDGEAWDSNETPIGHALAVELAHAEAVELSGGAA